MSGTGLGGVHSVRTRAPVAWHLILFQYRAANEERGEALDASHQLLEGLVLEALLVAHVDPKLRQSASFNSGLHSCESLARYSIPPRAILVEAGALNPPQPVCGALMEASQRLTISMMRRWICTALLHES